MLLKSWFRRRSAPGPASPDGQPPGPRLHFFGGKGGVGKTTCAGAYATALAQAGHKTLLVSVDPAHSIADLLDQRVGGGPTRVIDRLEALELDPDRAARDYLAEVKNNLRRIAAPELVQEAERQADLAMQAPGAEESALFDAITSVILDEGPAYDALVFDTAPTGHTLHLLTLPEVMGAWIEGMLAHRDRAQALWAELDDSGEPAGNDPDPARELLERRRARLRALREKLTDRAVSAFYLVLNPEALAVAETRRSRDTLREYGIPVAGLVINCILPPEAEGSFNEQRRQNQARHLKKIQRHLGGLPHARLQLTADEPRGTAALAPLGERLSTVFRTG